MNHRFIIQYIVVIVALILIGFGIYFVSLQANSTGELILELPFVSSKFSSGSSGLMMIFFGVIILIYVFRRTKGLAYDKEKDKEKISLGLKRQRNVLIFLWSMTILTYIGGYLDKYYNALESGSRYWGWSSILFFISLIKTVDWIEDYLEGKK